MHRNVLVNESWTPDRSSLIPLFKQIKDFIINKIASGEWSIGSRLPTQLAMAKQFGVNRSTILEVYDELKAEGFVESKRSLGTIIVNNTWSILTSTAPPNWGKKIEGSIHEPNLNMIRIINDADQKLGIIRLGAGELARTMMPKADLETIMTDVAKDISYMGYEEPKGLLVLREEIVKYLKTKGIITQASKILIVSGALQALHLISIGLLRRNATVLTEKSTYLKSLTLFDSYRINLSGVETNNKGIRLDDLTRKIISSKPELLYTIPNYHNPTGVLTDEKHRLDLLTLCEKEGLSIIEDDVYGELWYDSPPPNPIKANDKNGTVLYIGSISKTLSAGLRIGWIVGNENVIDRLADIKMQTDYGSSNMSQWMCYGFFKNGGYTKFTQTLRSELKEKRDLVLTLLDTYYKDIGTWNIPSGGLYIWLVLNKEVSPYKLFERCYEEGIVINTGSLYNETDKQSIRLSFGYASKGDLEEGLIKLANIIKTDFV